MSTVTCYQALVEIIHFIQHCLFKKCLKRKDVRQLVINTGQPLFLICIQRVHSQSWLYLTSGLRFVQFSCISFQFLINIVMLELWLPSNSFRSCSKEKKVNFSSGQLLKWPLVYLATNQMVMTSSSKRNRRVWFSDLIVVILIRDTLLPGVNDFFRFKSFFIQDK